MYNNEPIYTAYADGSHIHGNNPFNTCRLKHSKKLSNIVKVAILSGWFTTMVLLAHLILKSNNL